MREPPPLAAAPATERSERVGVEAEFLRKSDLSTYAPGSLSARDLTRPPGLSAGESAHGQAATAFASPFMGFQAATAEISGMHKFYAQQPVRKTAVNRTAKK